LDQNDDVAARAMAQDNPFTAVPVEVTVSVGKARPLVRDLVQLDENSILSLDKTVSDPVDLYVGDRLIARGELEEMDGDNKGQLAVRLTEIAVPSQGL